MDRLFYQLNVSNKVRDLVYGYIRKIHHFCGPESVKTIVMFIEAAIGIDCSLF